MLSIVEKDTRNCVCCYICKICKSDDCIHEVDESLCKNCDCHKETEDTKHKCPFKMDFCNTKNGSRCIHCFDKSIKRRKN